jgi:hypothetical protein
MSIAPVPLLESASTSTTTMLPVPTAVQEAASLVDVVQQVDIPVAPMVSAPSTTTTTTTTTAAAQGANAARTASKPKTKSGTSQSSTAAATGAVSSGLLSALQKASKKPSQANSSSSAKARGGRAGGGIPRPSGIAVSKARVLNHLKALETNTICVIVQTLLSVTLARKRYEKRQCWTCAIVAKFCAKVAKFVCYSCQVRSKVLDVCYSCQVRVL